MYCNLKNYTPEEIEYILDDVSNAIYPHELHFCDDDGVVLDLQGASRVVNREFSATFPDYEYAERRLDKYEIDNIREEYCELTENKVAKRKEELDACLERIKIEKKAAEEAYQSALTEVARYAAEVMEGKREVRLKPRETFCIALAGNYVYYAWDEKIHGFRLAKAVPIVDRADIWSSEDRNRDAMMKLFRMEFPEVKKDEPQDDDDLIL